jgi:predicted nucleic acid-binding protein
VILVDTNVLVDIMTDDPGWREWSLFNLQSAARAGTLHINAVIYAELAAAYRSTAELDSFLKPSKIRLSELSKEAAFLAGHVFLRYRKKRGTKTGVLPDFFIGAQAQSEGWKILTRDAGRYKTYFPSVDLICP